MLLSIIYDKGINYTQDKIMFIFIQNRVEFQSDYSPYASNWQVKNRDAFSFQVFNGTKCFVKRFTVKPSGWALLKTIRRRAIAHCPKVYDIVTTDEGGKTIYYYFSECLSGQTMAEALQAGIFVSIDKLLQDISIALHALQEQGYWFSDLNEENIFIGKDGKYYLIDLDSCWKKTIKPSPNEHAIGGLPGKSQEFAKYVSHFYKDILLEKNYQFDSLSGTNLNYLQLLAIATKLNYYYTRKKTQTNFTYISKNFKNIPLHQYLLNKNKKYIRGLHTSALNYPLLPEFLFSLKRFLSFPESDLPPPMPVTTNNKPTPIREKGTIKTPPSTTIPNNFNTWWKISAILFLGFLMPLSYHGYHTHQYNKAMEEGNNYYFQKKYTPALESYHAALEHKNNQLQVDQKINQIKSASLASYHQQAVEVNKLLNRKKYYDAQIVVQEFKSGTTYTYFLQDSIQSLDQQIQAVELAARGDIQATLGTVAGNEEAIKLYQKSLDLKFNRVVKEKLERLGY